MDLGTTGNVVGIIAAFTVVATFWRHIRLFLGYLRSLILVEVDLSGSEAFNEGIVAFMKESLKFYEVSPDKQFEAFRHYIQKDNKYKSISVENLFYKKYLSFYSRVPFLFSTSFGGNNNQTAGTHAASSPSNSSSCRIYYLRGTLKLDELLSKSLETYNKNRINSSTLAKRYEIIKYYGQGSMHSRQNDNINFEKAIEDSGDSYLKSQIMIGGKRLIGYELKDLDRGVQSEKSAFDLYAYPDYVMELVKEMVLWKKSEKWYAERDIEWRRGWLLHGRQGTGKTTLIKGIAQEIDVPIILFDLASMSNTEFNKYWNQAKSYGPCIVVFEDFDSVFSKRKNILGHAGGGLSFDSILNCLSGVDEANGVFLVVTTNKIEEIDEALGVPIDSEAIISSSSRPGRIDKTIKFGAMGEKEKNVIANKMLKDIDDINIEEIIKGTEDYTAAQFKEKCTEIALRHYWDNESIIGEIDEEKESIKRKAV